MDIATVDFETYWAKDHSLTIMSPLAYVMHPETELISCALKINVGQTEVVFGEDNIRAMLAEVNWSKAMAIAHNMAGFDALIMAWRLGINPRLWGCTLTMARPIFNKTVGLSLAKLVAHFRLGVKNNAALLQTQGKHLKDFTAQEIEGMRTYNRDDADQCYALFKCLRPWFTAAELWHIDATIRMLTEPAFVLDRPLLDGALINERTAKRRTVLTLARELRLSANASDAVKGAFTLEGLEEAVRVEMASAPKFAALLGAHGVEVPMKPSPSDETKMIPALAKTDYAYLALQEHDDPVVATAARCRLAIKSTIAETRMEALMQAADVCGGLIPAPIHYCGADTTGRDSGWSFNLQNLPIARGAPAPMHALRHALTAPKGYVIAVADLASIELRVNHFLWQVNTTMDLFRQNPKADMYRASAALSLRCMPDRVTPVQRQLSKTKNLGLGFGSGAVTFQRVARKDGFDFSLEQAQQEVDSWRLLYKRIQKGWYACGDALRDILMGAERAIDPWGLTHTCKEGIRLPSGRLISYPNLREVIDKKTGEINWYYADGRHKTKIYSSKIDENCLAAGTEVLTARGWVFIEQIRDDDLVHDGVEFVEHSGKAYKSVQACVMVDGVYMTPDHEVLCNEGWKAARESPEPYRPDLRHVDSDAYGGQRWEKDVVAVSVPMRPAVCQGWFRRSKGAKASGNPQLRMCVAQAGRGKELNPWDVEASGIRSVGFNESPLSTQVSSGLGQLRGARNSCMRTLGFVRSFLGRYGCELSTWAGPGSQRQRRAVFAGELPLDYPAGEHHEQAQHRASSGRGGTEPRVGYWRDDAVQPTASRMAGRAFANQASVQQPVYDIINCGPRHRFVVRGTEGPFIVHNCVQALARDILFDNMLAFFKLTKFRPVLRVHDELVYMFPEREAAQLLTGLQDIMRQSPAWWPQLITWSEGSTALTYGACKN